MSKNLEAEVIIRFKRMAAMIQTSADTNDFNSCLGIFPSVEEEMYETWSLLRLTCYEKEREASRQNAQITSVKSLDPDYFKKDSFFMNMLNKKRNQKEGGDKSEQKT